MKKEKKTLHCSNHPNPFLKPITIHNNHTTKKSTLNCFKQIEILSKKLCCLFTVKQTMSLSQINNASHESIKILEEKIGSNIFADIPPWARKNKQMGLHQTKKLLHNKGNQQQNEKVTHCMGEHICQWYI